MKIIMVIIIVIVIEIIRIKKMINDNKTIDIYNIK